MRIYLAAAFERQAELRRYRVECWAAGFRVTSRWLDVVDEHVDPRAAAEIDVIDLLAADVLVSFTDGRHGRGGRHAEFGIALGVSVVSHAPTTRYRWRYRLMLVGPREHVFHSYPGVERFDTWDQALAALRAPAPAEAEINAPRDC